MWDTSCSSVDIQHEDDILEGAGHTCKRCLTMFRMKIQHLEKAIIALLKVITITVRLQFIAACFEYCFLCSKYNTNIIKPRLHVWSGDGLASVLLILVLVSITLCNISYLQMSSLTTIIAWRGRWRGARRAARSWTIAIIKMIIHNTATAAQQHHSTTTSSPHLLSLE